MKPTATEKKALVEYARKLLNDWIAAGDTVYTSLKHVSSSGMSRDISLYIVHDGRIQDISGLVAGILDMKRNDKNGGIKIGGCGMDMGFSLVYDLSSVLFRGNDRAGYVLSHSWI